MILWLKSLLCVQKLQRLTAKPKSNLKPIGIVSTNIKLEYLYGPFNVENGRLNLKPVLEEFWYGNQSVETY